MASDDDIYLSEDEFCAQFKVSPRSAQRWRQTGEGPKWIRIGQRRVAYRQIDCRAWVATRTFAHRAEELQRAG